MNKYCYLRINLNERKQKDLWANGPDTREEYIRRVFGEEFKFEHDKRVFVYEPVESPRDYIAGFIGTPTQKETREGPDADWKHEQHEHWTTYNILIDPVDHPDGQKIAFGYGKIRDVESFFASISDYINNTYPQAKWHINIGVISSDEQYLTIAKQYSGMISRLEFRILAKNMDYQIDSSLKQALDLWDELGGDYSDHDTVSKEGGLDAEGEKTQQIVKYAQQSGGSVRAYDNKDSKIYDSKDKTEKTKIDIDHEIDKNTDRKIIDSLINKLFNRDRSK